MKGKSTNGFDKNIPIPPESRGRQKGVSKYNFGEMEIGDSKPITIQQKKSIYSCLISYNNSKKTTIKIRTGKDSTGILRFWRVE